jgi:hypothetical protein
MAATPESQRCSTSAMRTKAIEAAMFAADWLGCTLAEAPAAVAVQVRKLPPWRSAGCRGRARPARRRTPHAADSALMFVWASRMP